MAFAKRRPSRELPEAALLCSFTAGREGAALRELHEGGRGALDREEALSFFDISAGDRAEESPRVGMSRVIEDVLRAAAFHDEAAVEDRDPLTDRSDDSHIVGDQNDGALEFLPKLVQEREDLRLDRDVEGGRRLVRDEELRTGAKGHRDQDPLPHAAGQLMGILAKALLRGGDADLFQDVERSLPDLCSRPKRCISPKDLRELSSNIHEGVQRGHGVLEDHTDSFSA